MKGFDDKLPRMSEGKLYELPKTHPKLRSGGNILEIGKTPERVFFS
jgi:hypothetical protein